MPLKFRLKGLAETFVDEIYCPHCGHSGGVSGDAGFKTDLTRVTFDGIVVVVECSACATLFVPPEQRFGVVNQQKLRDAVERDCKTTGQPLLSNMNAVVLEVERLNALRLQKIH